MTDITIPPEVLEAAAKAAYQRATEANSSSYNDWDDPAQEAERQELIEVIRAACLAMLENWPGMDIERFAPWSKDRTIHLPMPQEARDD